MAIKNFLQTKGLWLILVLFFSAGVAGIFYDFGVNTVGDELPLMTTALKMISDRTLIPDYPTFYHVPLAVYFYLPFFVLFLLFLRFSGAFTSLEAIKEFGLLNFNEFLPFARLLTVLMGVFSIYLLYKISEKLFNNRVISLLASFLLSSSLMFVQMSHFARVWIPQLMAVLIAFYFITVLYQKEKGKIKDYILIGLGVGLAFGTHAIGVLIYFPFLIVHYLKNKGRKLKDIFLTDKNFWLVNFIFIFFYFLVSFLNPRGFKNYISSDGFFPSFNTMFGSSSSGGNILNSLGDYGYYFGVLIKYEPILILFSLFGFGILFFKERKKFCFIGSFVLVYYVIINLTGLVPRYILPVIPFLSLAAGYGLFYLYKKIETKINKRVALILVFLVLAVNSILLLLWDYRLAQPSTITAARSWIYDNIPSGEKIINFDNLLEINENKQAIEDIKNSTAQFTKKRAYLLSLDETDYPKPNYYMYYYAYDQTASKELLNKKYDYLIVGWWDRSDFEQKMARLKKLNLKQNFALVKTFPEGANENNWSTSLADLENPIYELFKLKQTGPTVYIYKTK